MKARRRRRQLVPYYAGALGDLGDSATGIPAVDAILATANKKVDRLVIATEICMVASVVAAAAGIAMLIRERR